MQTSSKGPLLLLLVLVGVYGCTNPPKRAGNKQYDLKGKVVALAADKKSVTIDHEDIPGLMEAMKMKLGVDDPNVLKGISPGDQVKGRLEVRPEGFVILTLEKL